MSLVVYTNKTNYYKNNCSLVLYLYHERNYIIDKEKRKIVVCSIDMLFITIICRLL